MEKLRRKKPNAPQGPIKALLIIAFTKSPGAFISAETPEGFYDGLGWTQDMLMAIYGVHRMRRMDPNFMTTLIKKQNIASFYSGFNFKHYVGRPGFSVTLFLDEKEFAGKYEDQLRQIAHELLPLREEPDFQERLEETFQALRNGEIEGVDESVEIKEEGAGHLSRISESTLSTAGGKHDTGEPVADQSSTPAIPVDSSVDVERMFQEIEERSLAEQVEYLKGELEAREAAIAQLQASIATVGSDSQLQAEVDYWKAKVAEVMEEKQIAEESIRRMTELDMLNAEEMQNQARAIKLLREQLQLANQTIETMKEQLASLNESNGQNHALGEKISELLDQVSDLEQERNRLEKEKKELEERLEREEELKKKIEKLTRRLAEVEREKDAAGERLVELETMLDDARKQIKDRDELVEGLKRRVKELEEMLAESSEISAEELKSDKLAALAESNEYLELRLRELEQKLAEERKKDLRGKLEALKKEMVELRVQNKLQRREIEVLKRRLGEE